MSKAAFRDLDMQGPGTPSLDQLRVFLAVVETGSFAAAGRHLGRATSAISYAIGNLEFQLGVSLFDRELTRKPQLTKAGRAVLSEARTISNGINGLRAKVSGLLQGLETARRPLPMRFSTGSRDRRRIPFACLSRLP